MRAVFILVCLISLLYRGYACTDVTIHDRPVSTAQAFKQGGSSQELSHLNAIELKEDDDENCSKKFKPSGTLSTLFHTIVVSHLYKFFYNRLPVYYPVPYRYLLLSALRI